MKKFAKTLAREHEMKTDNDYYSYIIESLINGQRQQVRNLFNAMHKDDQKYFLTTFLNVKEGYEKSVLNICIGELTK
jgi:hypothetical protein